MAEVTAKSEGRNPNITTEILTCLEGSMIARMQGKQELQGSSFSSGHIYPIVIYPITILVLIRHFTFLFFIINKSRLCRNILKHLHPSLVNGL